MTQRPGGEGAEVAPPRAMDPEVIARLRSARAPLHVERSTVRFQDVDAAGIVFYARVFDYFHDAYTAFLRARGVPLERAIADGSWVAPLRWAEAEYLLPLRFGDELVASIVEAELAETEFRLGYRLDVEGEPACVGRTLHVSVDPATFRRAPIPDVLRAALLPG